MPWSLGILALKNSFLFLLGGREGVYAWDRKRISSRLTEHLRGVFGRWGVDKQLIGDVYLAVTPGLERLLPPDRQYVHVRQTAYPVEWNPLLPDRFGKHLRCLNVIGERASCPEEIIRQGALADVTSVIASYSPLFPEREEQVKREILALNPDVRVYCSHHFPVLNFFLRDKCLVFQALSADILEQWYRDIVAFFGERRIRLWLVEDDALFWGKGDERPQRAGLEADRVCCFLMARGAAIEAEARAAVALFRKRDRFFVLEVNGKEVRPLGEDGFHTGRSLLQARSLLRNGIAAHKPILLFNFAGTELEIGYPFREKKGFFALTTLGLGLFNSPRRVKVYTFSLQKNLFQAKEELEVGLTALNREKGLFYEPRILFEEMPLRYLPYPGLFITAVLAPSGDLPDPSFPGGRVDPAVLPRYPR